MGSDSILCDGERKGEIRWRTRRYTGTSLGSSTRDIERKAQPSMLLLVLLLNLVFQLGRAWLPSLIKTRHVGKSEVKVPDTLFIETTRLSQPPFGPLRDSGEF